MMVSEAPADEARGVFLLWKQGPRLARTHVAAGRLACPLPATGLCIPGMQMQRRFVARLTDRTLASC